MASNSFNFIIPLSPPFFLPRTNIRMTKINQYRSSMRHWPREDLPREKLLKKGEHTLSNSELIAILLRTGTKGQSAVDLARKILQKFKTFRDMSHTDISNWRTFKGLGSAKIAQIKSAIEIGRRFQEEQLKEERPRIESSGDAAQMLMPRMRDLKKEVVKAIFLNSQNRIIDIIEVAEGTVNQANPIIRELFQRALQNFTVSLICVHNHPAGDPSPSPEDRTFTQKLSQGGRILQVNVLDHIIIGDGRYYSFADRGEL